MLHVEIAHSCVICVIRARRGISLKGMKIWPVYTKTLPALPDINKMNSSSTARGIKWYEYCRHLVYGFCDNKEVLVHFVQRVKGCILSNTFWEESQLEQGNRANCSLSTDREVALRHRGSWKRKADGQQPFLCVYH